MVKIQPQNNIDVIITRLLTLIDAKMPRKCKKEKTGEIKRVNYFIGIPLVPKQLHGQLLAACLQL